MHGEAAIEALGYLPDCVNLSNSELSVERGMLLEKKRIIH